MKKGFTLVELVIVIVIVGILSIIAVPIYQGYVDKARVAEAKAFIGSIKTAQDIYYAEHGTWYTSGQWVLYDEVLGIDARSNTYYKMFYTGFWHTHTGLWVAAVHNPDLNYENVNLGWNLDPSQPPVVHNGFRAPFYGYQIKGEAGQTYSSI